MITVIGLLNACLGDVRSHEMIDLGLLPLEKVASLAAAEVQNVDLGCVPALRLLATDHLHVFVDKLTLEIAMFSVMRIL